MVSQILFGETVEVIDKKDSWRKVRIIHDGYIGWVDIKQITELTPDEQEKFKSPSDTFSLDLVQLIISGPTQVTPLLMGSCLPGFKDKVSQINGQEYRFEGSVRKVSTEDPGKLIDYAYMYLNAPYLWGGRSPFGIDCSGFTQMILRLCGKSIARDAWQQAEAGETIHLLEESRTGDLAFFDNAEKKIIHTGIILQDNKIIHASGKVRIDRLDHQGIYNSERKEYTHNLRLIKRYFN